MSVMAVWLARLLGICLAILVAWGSLSYRLGGRVPGDFYDVGWNPEPAHWQTAPPDTWLRFAEAALEADEFESSEKYAMKALQAENFNAEAFSLLLSTYSKTSNHTEAEKVLVLASEYAPARAKVRAQIADYWQSRNRWDKVLEEWNKILIRSNHSAINSILYPALRQLIADPNGFPLFTPLLSNPPSWWDSFYSYLVREKVDIGLLNTIYQARSQSEVPLSRLERNLFVRRLKQDKQWDDAYYAWLSGLDENQMKLSSLLFDGGFEGTIFNSGFDWQIQRPKGIRIITANTSGAKGRRALRVLFNKKTINFRHISQQLILTPGKYTLSYRYRLNRLKNPEGVSWRIRCTDSTNNTNPILESPALKGRSPWQEETLNFTVPLDCPAQLLRLEASSKFSHKHTFSGSVWFDDFKISRNITPSEGEQE